MKSKNKTKKEKNKYLIGLVIIVIVSIIITGIVAIIDKKNAKPNNNIQNKLDILEHIDFELPKSYKKYDNAEENSIYYINEDESLENSITISLFDSSDIDSVGNFEDYIIGQIKNDFPDINLSNEKFSVNNYEVYKFVFELENYEYIWYYDFDKTRCIFVQVFISNEDKNTKIEEDAYNLIKSLKWKNDKDA